MICMCRTCIHYQSCSGENDDYADEEGGLCVHYRCTQIDEGDKE